ncbi:hypothetical protein ACFVJ5_07470 [Nocardia sp. NPDC127606]|uniref:hypothetical protein n=1 Tax=Nocardia sp. NPDC127606 TaxID=3345406 RepID=UPI00364215A5
MQFGSAAAGGHRGAALQPPVLFADIPFAEPGAYEQPGLWHTADTLPELARDRAAVIGPSDLGTKGGRRIPDGDSGTSVTVSVLGVKGAG